MQPIEVCTKTGEPVIGVIRSEHPKSCDTLKIIINTYLANL